jgi:hypothetical protein
MFLFAAEIISYLFLEITEIYKYSELSPPSGVAVPARQATKDGNGSSLLYVDWRAYLRNFAQRA